MQDIDVETHSTHYEGKYVVIRKFIRTSKNNIQKDVTSISKNVYIDKLANIVNEYNNAYHNKIKMKPTNLKSSTFIGFETEHNNHVRISKYKNIFAKGYTGLKKFW